MTGHITVSYKCIAAIVCCLALAIIASPANAQRMGIIATVNNTPISEFDLRARLEIVIAMAGLPRNNQTAKELAPKVVEMLIDEELKRQEAKSLGIEISKDEIELAVRKFEQERKLPPGGLFDLAKRLGAGTDTINQQVAADIAWSAALRQRFQALTQISEEEVEEEIARLEANKGQPVVLLSEIFLPVDNPGKDAEVRQISEKIVGELSRGASFASLATTFSQNATAAVGGDLGWVPLNSLSSESQAEILKTSPGKITRPVRSADGYTIYWYRQQRVSQGATGPTVDAQIVLQQLFIPITEAASSSEQNDKLSLAKRLRLRAGSCKAMELLPRQVSGGLTSNQSTLRMSQLAPKVREAIQDLQDNTASEPVKVPGAILLFMICSRESENSEKAQHTQIRNRLIDDRLTLASRQYLRDLKRHAFIERR